MNYNNIMLIQTRNLATVIIVIIMHVIEFGLQLISDATTLDDETNITKALIMPSTNPNSQITPGKADKHFMPCQNFVYEAY